MTPTDDTEDTGVSDAGAGAPTEGVEPPTEVAEPAHAWELEGDDTDEINDDIADDDNNLVDDGWVLPPDTEHTWMDTLRVARNLLFGGLLVAFIAFVVLAGFHHPTASDSTSHAPTAATSQSPPPWLITPRPLPPAHADPSDEQFTRTLNAHLLSVPGAVSDAELIKLGHTICGSLAAGSRESVQNQLAADGWPPDGARMSTSDASWLITASVAAYCPHAG